MSKDEINGFLVDKFNQHSLKEGATQGICPLCSSDRKPKTRKHNVLLMIGNVVSVLVTTVILHFNFILINARALAKRFILDLIRLPTLTR